MSGVPSDRQLIDFVLREARLLDEQRLDDWLDLFTEDGRYWMPVEWGQTDPRLTTSLMYEDRMLLKIRIERLKGRATYSQSPKSRCHHVLQTPQVDERDDSGNRYVTWTPLHYVESRADEPERHDVVTDGTSEWQMRNQFRAWTKFMTMSL